MTRLVLLEIMLVLCSVLIFRSLWVWLDRWPWLHTDGGLAASLAAGLIGAVFVVQRLNRCTEISSPASKYCK